MATTQAEVEQSIREFLARIDKPVDELTPDLTLYAEGIGLDSIETAELSAVLEDDFGTDPFSADTMPQTVGEILAFYGPRRGRGLIDLLRRVADDDPSRVAIVVDEGTTTYGELAAVADEVAAALTARGIRRFGILDHDAATVVTLLAGACLAGAEACQYPPTDDPAEVLALAARFEHDVIVSRQDISGVTIVPPDDLRGAAGEGTRAPDAHPLLVLTTGTTTGTPRGVRHDWTRLLRGTRHVAPAVGQRWLLAYGLHQFAGLQIVLHVFAAGATLVAPAPRRPREGLAAMRRHGVTHASATPTYWRFLLAEMHADGGPVPALEQITLGGEAVPGPLLQTLRSTFPGARQSQIYAASEFGSSGSQRDGRSGLSLDVLARGDDDDLAMRIVDGELWVRSCSGMLGYHGEEPVDPDAWRATGDLVEIVADRIVFRGRTSEIINVGGVKVHPLPIEELVSTVPGVAVARVYGRPNPLTGAIVAVEIVPTPDAEAETVKTGVRAACAALPAAARPRSIRFVDSVATTGHKIVRRQP